jgi:hypothetical protein
MAKPINAGANSSQWKGPLRVRALPDLPFGRTDDRVHAPNPNTGDKAVPWAAVSAAVLPALACPWPASAQQTHEV